VLELCWGMPSVIASVLTNNAKAEPELNGDSDDVRMYNEFLRILDNKAIRAVFQPIVSLVDAAVLGYEALSRGPQGSMLERPDMLFGAAEKLNKVWELEFLCRATALERAKLMPPDKMLFINVDPKIIHDERFQKGLTREILAKYQIDPTNIIFEITEKTSVEDYRNFRRILDNYTSQGYKIAIDDTGSGYSGLRMLAETRPQFIKIDMQLVRDIDKDALKQALIRAFYDFAVAANMKIIAEGIETQDELNTLIDIGVHYGQGYLLQCPAPEFLEISPQIIKLIAVKNQQKKKEAFYTAITMPVGETARQDCFFLPDALGSQALDVFNANPNLLGIPVVENGKPVGLLMKATFLSRLATQYGVAVYMNRPVSLLMDKNPLTVDYHTPLEQVSKLAVARTEDTLYDYIIVTQNSKYYGITTVKNLLEKTTQLEINRAKHSNPLSGLPGNIMVEEKLKQAIESGEDFSVLYIDLDNFKPYNDLYGFENGDKILCMTAQLLQNQINNLALPDAFLGHIGGDDFIAVIKEADVERLCQTIIKDFDVRVRAFYTEEDENNGFIIAKNRHGIEEQFPLISISIAVVNTQGYRFRDVSQLAEVAGQIKKQCKLNWQSCYNIAKQGVECKTIPCTIGHEPMDRIKRRSFQ